MNEDCLKLTTYFGERDRAGRGSVADALLDLYAEAEIETSVLLRGASGFGLRHHLRTDRLLTLSEDLPLVSVAVDARPRIEAVLDAVTELQPRGLLTLERARMVGDGVGEIVLPEQLGEATKLTVYVGRREQIEGKPAFAALCDLLQRRGVAGATALLGVDGTVRGARRRARFLGRNRDVPMMVLAVGSGERIAAVLPELGALFERPLFTLERLRICKRDGQLIERPHPLPASDERGLGLWQKLTVYSSQAATLEGRPLHDELIRRLRESKAAGATAMHAVWGYHGDHPPHGDRLLRLRRTAPVVTIAIDRPDRIAAAFEIVDELTAEHGLVTSEIVPAMRASSENERRGGLRLARHRS